MSSIERLILSNSNFITYSSQRAGSLFLISSVSYISIQANTNCFTQLKRAPNERPANSKISASLGRFEKTDSIQHFQRQNGHVFRASAAAKSIFNLSQIALY